MPVGTSFENSAMKASFSLSSLHHHASETPDNKGIKPRQFNSLTKKRKDANLWRRSWGSSASDQKDEFWSALQANYNYIMDNELIDNCQEANGELSLDSPTWSLKEFFAQFSELYSWLNSIQEDIYGNEENTTDKALRAHYMSSLLKKAYFHKIFNEQASQLIHLHPEAKEEINWRVTHLNSKWETIESALHSSDCNRCDQESCIDVDNEIKCLRKWIKNMESCIEPLDFKMKWTPLALEATALEHQVLHREIQNHGKIVNSVVKLCKRKDSSCSTINAGRVASGLERRWHLLYLMSLEWQCYIESLVKQECDRGRNNSCISDNEFDDEPVTKQPRLSGSFNSLEDDEITDQRHDSNCMMTSKLARKPGDVISEDTSQFRKSNRTAPNLGTYYFKHIDTDSDMEKVEKNNAMQLEDQVAAETTDDEWTYTKGDQNDAKDEMDGPTNNSQWEIHRLVEEVEELVSPIKHLNKNKINQVKQWLNMGPPDDSCDASGEDEERESQTSEDLNESIVTYRVAQKSFELQTDSLDDSTPKVHLRRSNLKANRPWSVSCISQLDNSANRVSNHAPTLSTSESALHKLSLVPKRLEKSFNESANSIGLVGNASTSSTMEDSNTLIQEEKTSPVRRKRYKIKKRNRKSETSAQSNADLSKPAVVGKLVKSGSFSGTSCTPHCPERHTVSDPSTAALGYSVDTSTTSGADTDDEKKYKRTPLFKLNKVFNYSLEIRDSSPGKSSVNAAEEQFSSLSEQAWDSYQEKYLSEAYSEAHDSDAARRLLEFGEDYRNFMDSQSDWSSQSNTFSPPFPRKVSQPLKQIDSDSDTSEDKVRLILKNSHDQLEYANSIYKNQFALGLEEYLVANEIKDMVATCERHLFCLNLIEKSPEEYKLPKSDKEQTSDLLLHWENLKSRVNKMQEYRNLQKEILQFKGDLQGVKVPVPNEGLDINSMEDVSRDIDFYTVEMTNISKYKEKLLQLNVAVHRFLTENKDYNVSSLKMDVSELYRIWNEIRNSINDRLMHLNSLLQTWQMLESRLDQLRGDLKEDEQALGLLADALQDGNFSNQMATSVQDVAKLLSKSKLTQNTDLPEIFTEGSLSDSGISDEGSEHDLGERERRLAAIRRLVRQLETVMAPDCQARVLMGERLLAAEEELKSLQKRCRSLFVRTAESATANPDDPTAVSGSSGDPDDEPSSSTWFERVLRASVPFQIAIIALICVACFLEPHCCDNVNNFSYSLSPQLHYVRGPPPI